MSNISPQIPSSGTHLEKVGVAIWAPNRKKEMPYVCWAFPINDIMDITAWHQHQQRYTERLDKWPFIELFDGQSFKHLPNVDLLWQKVDKYLKRTQATSRFFPHADLAEHPSLAPNTMPWWMGMGSLQRGLVPYIAIYHPYKSIVRCKYKSGIDGIDTWGILYDTYPLTCITCVFFRVNPWFQLPLRDIPVPDPQTLLESKDDACKKAGYLCGRNVLNIWLTDLGDSILFPTRRHFDQCNPDCGSTHWFLGILDENRGSSPLPKGSLVKVLIWKHDTLPIFKLR